MSGIVIDVLEKKEGTSESIIGMYISRARYSEIMYKVGGVKPVQETRGFYGDCAAKEARQQRVSK